MQVREATLGDYAALMDRVFLSFCERNPNHRRFEDIFPDSVVPTEECMRQWLIALEGDEIAAGMQTVPRPLIIAGNVTLQASGLGNVFTYPPYREHGHMSALLEASIARMERSGDAVNLLGGDRRRYGNYGWERVGAARHLQLSLGMKRHEQIARPSVVGLRHWRGDRDLAERMRRCHERLPYRDVRSPEQFPGVLSRPGQNVWVCDSTELGFAYMAVAGSNIREYAGDRQALEHILRYALAGASMSVAAPPVDGETDLEHMFLDYTQSFSVTPTAMGRIVSLDRVIRSYEPILRERLTGWQGAVSLRIRESGETLSLSSSRDSIEIGSAECDLCVELPLTEMALLVFGPFAPSIHPPQAVPMLRLAFPLPLYWPGLSHV